MHSRFFPRFSERNILDRVYSYHARMHVNLPNDIDFREFVYLTDMLDKDLRDAHNAKMQQDLINKAR